MEEPETHKHCLDPDFTEHVINSTGPKASPRMRQIIGPLIRHIHDFAKEVELTMDEFLASVELINESGRMSNATRNEGQLVCDVIGLEPLVDEITNRTGSSASAPTETTGLGPFYRANAPIMRMGASIVHGIPHGDHTFMHGRVVDFRTGKSIEGAELDLWHTAPNGLYEQQDPKQADFNLRGRFFTGKHGEYALYCLRPTAYPIPDDGPAGKLLKLLDRHPMRPGHIHFILRAPGYKAIITQLFDRNCKYVTDDAAFATKQELLVDFVPLKGNAKAGFELKYDFRMATLESKQEN